MITFTCRISEHGEIVLGDEIATLLKAHPGSVVQCEILNQSDELVQRIAEMQALEKPIVIARFKRTEAVDKRSGRVEQAAKLVLMCRFDNARGREVARSATTTIKITLHITVQKLLIPLSTNE